MEVISKSCKTHPSCPHGPCLMFERHTSNVLKSGKRFFACSACRDRSICSFFHWVDDKFSDHKREHWKQIIEASQPPFTHEEYGRRRASFRKLQQHKRKYCKTCSLLILPTDKKCHEKHELVNDVSLEQLLQPSLLFHTLSNKKAEAQYFFTTKTINFVTSLLKKLNFTKLVLIGVPKMHEYLNSKQDENIGLSSFLMDIDHRYMQFFDPEQFCQYNLFNNHFFNGKASKAKLYEFITESNEGKVAVLLDPPFGGLIDAISFSLKKLNKYWQVANRKSNLETVPLLWFFPYFLEFRIVKNFPDLVMMDYKVEYSNHKTFGGKAGSKGSPIRIFTNIPTPVFTLPENEGYRYCKECQKYVSPENQHCKKCNKCTTKHGSTYKHCDKCHHCVKSSYVHCEVHNRCVKVTLNSNKTPGELCKCGMEISDKDNSNKCFKCFGYGHRKRECPTNARNKQGKRKKTKR